MNDCPNKCQFEKEIEMLKKDAEQNKLTHEKFFARFEEVSLRQGIADERLSNILAMLSEIKNDLSALKDRPSKRWELVVSALITGVVAVVIALIFKGGV